MRLINGTIERVFIDALSLPARARAMLVQKLLLSLQTEEDSPEVEDAWKREALDRCNAFDKGKLTERDAVHVLRDAYQKLK